MQLKQDEIVSIEYIGERETADIEIMNADGEHQRNYFANGINVHNSGAMNQYPAYKFGRTEKTKSIHPIIDKWTEDTYGLIIYQEQVMQIVRELGGFDWAQTNTVRKVMSKSGGAEYFMKTFWPTWKENCQKKGMDEKTALKAFHKIMSFGSWAFNKSFIKGTKILNTNPNQFAPKYINIEELYDNGGYSTDKAKKNPYCYVKMNTLSKCGDGKLRPAKIKEVYYHGKQMVWEIKVESGKTVTITKNTRMSGLDENGESTFLYGGEIVIGSMLEMDSGYEISKYIPSGEGKGWAKHYKGNLHSETNKPFKNGKHFEVEQFRTKMLGKPCQRCGEDWHYDLSFEVHHVNRKPPNSKLRWLCNRCHKIEDYELGNRVKQWSKGYPTHFEKVISKKYMGFIETYDIEMEDSSRPTFIANGFVSHNSHSVSYALVSYMCMWLKVHYPIEFVTAYLNTVNDTTKVKISGMIKEAQRLGIQIKEPNINFSTDKFVIKDGAIICGLLDIKNVGQKAVDAIVENQPYKGLLSFISKVNNRACNKRSVEHLIMAGAFDDFHYNKKLLLANLADIFKFYKGKSEKSKQKAVALINSCKGQEDHTKQELAEMKRSISPMSIGKHVCEYYTDVSSKFGEHVKLTKLIDIELDDGEENKSRRRKQVYVVGLLTKVDLKRLSQEVKEVIDASQEKRYALGNLEDETDFIVLSFRDTIYEQYEKYLYPWRGSVMLVQGEVNEGQKKLYVSGVWIMQELRENPNRDFSTKYLFKHPIHRWFKDIKALRLEHNWTSIIDVVTAKTTKIVNYWSVGYVSSIQTRKIRKECEWKGQDMHIVTFEDETYQGSFILFPSDTRYKKMRRIFFDLYSDRKPFLLKVQRDYKVKPEESEYRQVTLSIDKRAKIEDCVKTPFKFGS